ncbi:MAG: arginine repressor [Sphingomicrobium sp.]
MTELRNQRQRIIADIIREHRLSSQEELAERLAALGHVVTQATISRDLEALGAVKLRRGGQLGYALPESGGASLPPGMSAVFRDWVRSIDTAGTLVVIKTPPGSAHLVAVVLDQSGWAEIVGTISGDDTIFVACLTFEDADRLKDRLGAASAGELQ